MRTLVVISILLLTACQADRHVGVDPEAERAAICGMLTCGR